MLEQHSQQYEEHDRISEDEPNTDYYGLMVITVKESKKSQFTLSATHLRTHMYKRLIFTFFFFFLFSVHLYHNIFQKSTTYNKTQGFTFGYVIIKARFKKI